MRKCFWGKVLLICLALGLCSVQNPAEAAQEAGFSQAQLERMSTFLSNFTELGFMNFDLEKSGDDDVLHLGGDPSDPDLIRFGIWHNYLNNYQSRIRQCPVKDCEHGSLVIDAKAVAESVKKYFNIDLTHRSVDQSDPPYYFDGKLYHFEGADGEAVYHAEVKQALQEDGIIRMTGDIYNADNREDRPCTFEATARPCRWDGKDTWAILSMKTTAR